MAQLDDCVVCLPVLACHGVACQGFSTDGTASLGSPHKRNSWVSLLFIARWFVLRRHRVTVSLSVNSDMSKLVHAHIHHSHFVTAVRFLLTTYGRFGSPKCG